MIGIYKFTNKINGKSYIGQSIDIKKRYFQHKTFANPANNSIDTSYFHKIMDYYGFDNFDFEVLEECERHELDEKEIEYISKYNTTYPNGYNISPGGNLPHFMKLNSIILNEIYKDLEDNVLTEKQIAEKYSINYTTVSFINLGKLWRDKDRHYPIRKPPVKKEYYCIKCGAKLWGKCKTNMCPQCYLKNKPSNIPTKEELYDLLLSNSFLYVGKMFNVSDNAVRKWCDKYNIPRHSSYYRKQREIST